MVRLPPFVGSRVDGPRAHWSGTDASALTLTFSVRRPSVRPAGARKSASLSGLLRVHAAFQVPGRGGADGATTPVSFLQSSFKVWAGLLPQPALRLGQLLMWPRRGCHTLAWHCPLEPAPSRGPSCPLCLQHSRAQPLESTAGTHRAH